MHPIHLKILKSYKTKHSLNELYYSLIIFSLLNSHFILSNLDNIHLLFQVKVSILYHLLLIPTLNLIFFSFKSNEIQKRKILHFFLVTLPKILPSLIPIKNSTFIIFTICLI